MAMVKQITGNFASFIGSPSDDTAYDELDFGFLPTAIKIIVSVGTLDVSVNGSDSSPHMSLPVGQYDFIGLKNKKLFVRQTGATAQILAWTN